MLQFFLWICVLGILEHFDTENYTWRFVIVQNLCEFWQFFLSHVLAQNILILPSPKIPEGQNVLMLPISILLIAIAASKICINHKLWLYFSLIIFEYNILAVFRHYNPLFVIDFKAVTVLWHFNISAVLKACKQ